MIPEHLRSRVLSLLPLAIALLLFFLHSVYTFELTGRLEAQIPWGWRTNLFLGRMLIALPILCSIPMVWGRYRIAAVFILLYTAGLYLDALAGAQVFTDNLIAVLWGSPLWISSWLLSAALAFRFKVQPVPYYWASVVLIVAVLGGVFLKHKIYQPDLLAVPAQLLDLIELSAFGDYQAQIPANGYILMYSSGCSTCYKLAKAWKLESTRKTLPAVQFVMGPQEQIARFKKKTSNEELIVLDRDTLLDLSGPSVPVMYKVENGEIIKKWVGDAFSYPQFDAL